MSLHCSTHPCYGPLMVALVEVCAHGPGVGGALPSSVKVCTANCYLFYRYNVLQALTECCNMNRSRGVCTDAKIWNPFCCWSGFLLQTHLGRPGPKRSYGRSKQSFGRSVHVSNMYLQRSFATNWKASSENRKVLFEDEEGFVQRALALYVPTFLKNGAASLWNLGINFKDAYRTSGTMREFLIWNA